MQKTLRPYQEAATEAAVEYLTTKAGKPLVIAPVAAGKSLLMAELMRRAVELYRPMRFLSLADSSTLLTQNAAELTTHAPHISHSFYAAKLGQKNLTGQCIFASVQSIYRNAWKIPPIGVCLVDEAHMTSSADAIMYRSLLEVLWKGNPDMRLVGYTGTPFDTKGFWLHEAPGALFTDIAYSISMTELIEDGHLCPLITPQQPITKIDVSGVKTLGGDFKLNELEAASDRPEIVRACVAELISHGADRKKWMVFAVSVKHAEHIRDEIRRYGISCETIVGDTENGERTSIINDFDYGELRCLVSVATLTKGFNVEKIDLISMQRPSKSRVYIVQTAGRGMRLFPGKTDCLYLDHGSILETFGPIDKITARPPKRSASADAPMKGCPQCHEILFASARICHACDHVFPILPGDINLSDIASSAAALSTQKIDPLRTRVDGVDYKRHEKAGSPPSLMVEYSCGAARHREWICFQHTGRARASAMQWWMSRSDGNPPLSVDEALARLREIEKPSAIDLVKDGKYFKIVGYAFDAPLGATPTMSVSTQHTIAAGTP